MPFYVHALMQNTDDFNAAFILPEKDDMAPFRITTQA